MKRYFSVVCASILGFCGVLAADKSSQPTVEQSVEQNALPSGLLFVKETRESYYSGAYKSFLESTEKTYQKNRKDHKYDSFLEARREASKITTTMQQVAKAVKQPEFEKKSDDLLSKRNKKLSEIIVSHDNDSLAQSLKNSVFFAFSDDQKDALNYYFDLHSKFKGDGSSPLENELIAIDTEYWLKQRDLDLALINGKYSQQEYEKYTLVLELAKLEALKNAALKEPESKLSHSILVAHAVYPTQAAIVHDQKLLVQLGEGKIASHSQLEQKLQDVMKQYIQERTELTAKYFPENSIEP